MLLVRCAATMLLLLLALAGQAAEPELPRYKQTKLGLYVSAREAAEIKRERGAEVVLIDVRTRAEIAYVGMPTSADANIPYLRVDFDNWDDKSGFFSMQRDPQFETAVARLLADMKLDKDSELLLICRSGGRSAAAVDALAAAGYSRVYSVVDGFEGDKQRDGPDKGRRTVNGWKNAGAEWSTSIDKSKLY